MNPLYIMLAIGAVLLSLLLFSPGKSLPETPVQFPSVENAQNLEVATLAGGCFWCTEAALQELEGVVEVTSGYAGGKEVNPSYEDVYTGKTTHREAVQVFYDPEIISYDTVLERFLQTIDPSDDGGQFIDRGFSYTTAIFTHSKQQATSARLALEQLKQSGRFDQIVTPVIDFSNFYIAEEYHQDFYLLASENYRSYEENSGREEFKAAVWADILESNQQ